MGTGGQTDLLSVPFWQVGEILSGRSRVMVRTTWNWRTGSCPSSLCYQIGFFDTAWGFLTWQLKARASTLSPADLV